ncbi:sulfate adenylyltransferase subunit CysN [Emcibacter sp.]|uniref:sulfate adenylyltransferase subunit CysN n=1 Tax=Emcibacter sp. TaxID=1979954 RepID=UPI003A92F26F
MAHQSALISEDILEYLKSQERKSLLRFITCGSVDDGKSTLIGRLLYDSKMIFEDQLSSLESDSKKVGTQGGDMDFALLVDGLAAEREQGITIDVAYRFFSTDKRKFIVADTPGHEQYTRNMATGASNADLAIILIDARKGILTQTRRHSYIVSLLGIKHVLLAVNKMDLMDYDQKVFDQIESDYRAFAADIGLTDITCVPISALKGDNILERGDKLDWYDGPTLMEVLETVDVTTDEKSAPFRFPVQWVNRPDLDFRGFSGTIVSGTIRTGDEIVVLPSAKTSRVKRIVTMSGDLDQAIAGQAVTLSLEDEIDISRGDVICRKENRAELTDQFMAHVLWMDDEHLLPGRPYLIKIGTKTVSGVISSLKHKINVNSLEHEAGKALELNEVGVCNLSLSDQIPYDHYSDIRETGAFIIINRLNNNTVGVGMIDHGLRRAENIHWQALDVDKISRATQKSQKPAVLWFTGYSGSGKSTVANALEKKLFARGNHTYVLDGDNVRHGLNKDLGFTDVDRVENIRRVSETSKLMVDAGLITLVSFISPFRSERRMAREAMEEGEFIEIFINTPLEVCEQRDPKGLYKKARAGEIKNFTGFDSPYEEPDDPELAIDTTDLEPEKAADRIIEYLEEKGYLSS